MKKLYNHMWDKSYERGENHIIFPQTEVIRFLHKYVKKAPTHKGVSEQNGQVCLGLDFGCGIGTHAFSMTQFGCNAIGCDISASAIEIANARRENVTPIQPDFVKLTEDADALPFATDQFDFIVAESCLDSMPFHDAKAYAKELKRVCSGPIYASFMARDTRRKKDYEIEDKFEEGTFQTIFDEGRVCELFEAEMEEFGDLYLISSVALNSKNELINWSRIYCVYNTQG